MKINNAKQVKNIKPIKKRWLSPSSINTYIRCPHKFYLQYVKKLKTKPNIHLIRGSIVHKTVERFFREGYSKISEYGYYDEYRKVIIELFNDEWSSKRTQLLNLNLKDQDLAFYYNDSKKMLINFIQDYLKNPALHQNSPLLEQTIFSKKYQLMGRIDAVYCAKDPPVLIDYKTCKSIDPSNKDYKRQMAIYSILYQDKYNVKPSTAIHYFKFLDGLRTVNVSDNDIEELKNTIIKIHHETLSTDEKDYPCRCGGWCNKDFTKPKQNDLVV